MPSLSGACRSCTRIRFSIGTLPSGLQEFWFILTLLRITEIQNSSLPKIMLLITIFEMQKHAMTPHHLSLG